MIRKKSKTDKFARPVMEKLGAKMTTGSGNVFGDGDGRLGPFLIEHKYKGQPKPQLPYAYYEKIRREAHKRDLTPILIATTRKKEDFVIIAVDDLEVLFEDPLDYIIAMPPNGKPYNTLHVDSDMFLEAVTPWRGDAPTILMNLLNKTGRPLCMMELGAFKSLVEKRGLGNK